jgi:hypothetical protein
VAVRPETEEDQVECRRERDVGRAQRMDLAVGNVDPVQERFTREALVRVRVVGRNVPLVAPPNVPVGPVDVVPRQSFVDRAGCGTAGERNAKATRTRTLGDPTRRVLA